MLCKVGNKGLMSFFFNALHMLCYVSSKKGRRKMFWVVRGRRRGWCVGVFLPNRDLISEPEHTVCKDATRHGANPLLSVGRLAL